MISQNSIFVNRMAHPRDVSEFLRNISRIIKNDTINIDFRDNAIYPAGCIPIFGTIDHLKTTCGKSVICHVPPNSYISSINFENPYKVREHADSLAYPFSKVWLFENFEDVTKLVNAFVLEIQSITKCSKGLIEGLEWSLNEVMDNVIQHSLALKGYVMGVYHKSTDYVLFDIYDNGQGIFNSLKDSEYHPRNAIDAISIAIQEGKTRDKKIGQGNGLWGLYNIIKENKGKLCITSSGSSLMMKNDGSVYKFNELPLLSPKLGTTSVDFSFNCKEDISITNALGGYTPIDISFENSISDDNWIEFSLANESTGYGTREAGERLRNKVFNALNRIDSPQRIRIDFSGISIISSSFADEFIGKLLQLLGFYKFNQMVKILNANYTVEVILNRSISQRMAEIYKDD